MAVSAPGRIVRSVCYVRVEDIVPGPLQPRQHITREGLEELRDSIAQHGVLQPLTVRLRGDRFELIAGERRLRAARLAGLREVPCIVMDVDMEQSGLIALIENIQRRDLDFLEEAEGIRQLIRLFGLSQEQVARRLGKSQSAVANKLRILRLPSDVLERLRSAGMGERHARALLRLDGEERQREALDFMVEQRMNVAAAEAYVERLCGGTPGKEPEPKESQAARRRSVFLMKDLRLFLNTLDRSLSLMRSGGIDAQLRREETEEAVVVTVRIPKNR
ncbi:MAG: ParB/RepB/Spo0J family partition protein [Oscillospiraceae bacterium]|nr:ParB/RepB/Spo0J family partition protein [Oscillospiraceae bacterium]MBR3861302.1 ParB/RepB/Spo0J family partition protein [Oscillospiraceae bacterium]MBR7055845.1 ParB/RepB/Spo0J family partition protein [Oscillospiraceae bacterium]